MFNDPEIAAGVEAYFDAKDEARQSSDDWWDCSCCCCQQTCDGYDLPWDQAS